MLSVSLTNYVQVDTDDLCLQRKLLKQVPIFSLLDQYLAPEQKRKRNGFTTICVCISKNSTCRSRSTEDSG